MRLRYRCPFREAVADNYCPNLLEISNNGSSQHKNAPESQHDLNQYQISLPEYHLLKAGDKRGEVTTDHEGENAEHEHHVGFRSGKLRRSTRVTAALNHAV